MLPNHRAYYAFCASVSYSYTKVSSINTTETEFWEWMRDEGRVTKPGRRGQWNFNWWQYYSSRRRRVARMCFYLFILWMMSVRLWKGFWDMISVDLLTFFIYFLYYICYLLCEVVIWYGWVGRKFYEVVYTLQFSARVSKGFAIDKCPWFPSLR